MCFRQIKAHNISQSYPIRAKEDAGFCADLQFYIISSEDYDHLISSIGIVLLDLNPPTYISALYRHDHIQVPLALEMVPH